MKHAAIFTRLAQRADPNIPILEAAMDEISQLEDALRELDALSKLYRLPEGD